MNNKIRDAIRRHSRELLPQPTSYPTLLKRLDGIRAVLFDIYGTLFISGSGDIGANQPQATGNISVRRNACAHAAFQAAGLPSLPDQVDVYQLLTATIKAVHAEMRSKGNEHPEVDIVDVWRTVLERLRTQEGWNCPEITEDLLRQLAVEYEIRTNSVWPMPGAVQCLQVLRDAGMLLGVVSNAQFYTPELFPALWGDEMSAYGFDPQLCWFSYQQLRAKPGTDLYQAARDELGRRGIAADEAVFVGNDLLNDVVAASQVGFRTALFAGDRRSLRLREGDRRTSGIVPDLIIDQWNQFPGCVAN